jgi:hypothetical protein
VVVGEAGVGKTMLAREVRRRLGAGGWHTELVLCSARVGFSLPALAHAATTEGANELRRVGRSRCLPDSSKPTVLLVDDAHLLDDESSELLWRVAGAARHWWWPRCVRVRGFPIGWPDCGPRGSAPTFPSHRWPKATSGHYWRLFSAVTWKTVCPGCSFVERPATRSCSENWCARAWTPARSSEAMKCGGWPASSLSLLGRPT